MNTHVLKNFQTRFESELRELQQSAIVIKRELRESAEVNSQAHQDELDCAKGESDLSTQVEIYNHTVKRVGQLHAALSRIANGTFGMCLACEYGIDARRIKVHPCAALCFECQSHRETGDWLKPRSATFIPRWLGREIPDLEKAA